MNGFTDYSQYVIARAAINAYFVHFPNLNFRVEIVFSPRLH